MQEMFLMAEWWMIDGIGTGGEWIGTLLLSKHKA